MSTVACSRLDPERGARQPARRRTRARGARRKGALEIIDLAAPAKRRRVANGVRAVVGCPGRRAVYAAMADGNLCRLDADTGAVQARLGELGGAQVHLMVDPQEHVVWAALGPSGRLRGADTLIAFGTGSAFDAAELRRADIRGHEVFSACFHGDTLVTAGWDATVRQWDPREPMPATAIAGSAPFRCVDAARIA